MRCRIRSVRSEYVTKTNKNTACFQNAFVRNGHVDVLDLVCIQCEPDSADYIRVGLSIVFIFKLVCFVFWKQLDNSWTLLYSWTCFLSFIVSNYFRSTNGHMKTFTGIGHLIFFVQADILVAWCTILPRRDGWVGSWLIFWKEICKQLGFRSEKSDLL